MSSIELQKPFLEGGTRSINFFNGRLLTAEDLSTERDINRLQHQQLGQAIGAGIVTGLQVQLSAASSASSTTSILTVLSGQALNRKGQVLSLPSDVDVVLVPPQTPGAVDAGMFAVCDAPTLIPVFTGYGAYILVLTPASGFEGRAPVNGVLPGDVTRASCGSRYVVEGVKFGLVQLDITTLPNISQDTRTALAQLMTQSDLASLSMLRNRLAHLCFGTEELGGFLSDPFRQVNGASPYVDVGALATLRTQGKLTDCDVPLALLYWTTKGIQFVDMGSVRRRPVPGPPSQYWPFDPAGGYPLNGEAVSVQFQEQITQMTSTSIPQSQLASMRISDYFQYLPAAGIIPLSGIFSGFVIAKGFSTQFLDGTTHRDPVFIEGGRVEHLIRTSLSYQPIDLSKQEMFWTYWIRENIQAITESTTNPPQPSLFFVTGHIPYQGDAQYNIAHWQYSNFATTMNTQA